jgi:hypothetical protein
MIAFETGRIRGPKRAAMAPPGEVSDAMTLVSSSQPFQAWRHPSD